MLNNFFFWKFCHLWGNVEECYRMGQATDDNIAHAHCMLDTQGYKHTLKMCNTYCCSTAMMVAQMCLNVTLYEYCLSCSVFLDQFGYPLLYLPTDDVLTSCPYCKYFYYFQYIFHSYPTHHPSGDGPSGWTYKAVITTITFLPSQHWSTTFHHIYSQHSCTVKCHCIEHE